MDVPTGRLGRLVGAGIRNRDLRRPARHLRHAPHRPPGLGETGHSHQHLAGGFNTFVLLTSSLSAVLAHQAAEHGDGRKAAKFLRLTVARRPGVPRRSRPSSGRTRSGKGFTITLEPVLVVLLHGRRPARAARHRRHGRHADRSRPRGAKNQELHRVENIGIYWHFVDIVWIFLFPLLYIAK